MLCSHFIFAALKIDSTVHIPSTSVSLHFHSEIQLITEHDILLNVLHFETFNTMRTNTQKSVSTLFFN